MSSDAALGISVYSLVSFFIGIIYAAEYKNGIGAFFSMSILWPIILAIKIFKNSVEIIYEELK